MKLAPAEHLRHALTRSAAPQTLRLTGDRASSRARTSVRHGYMAIYIEVDRVHRERDLHAVHFSGKNDLTAKAAGRLEAWRRVEHILLVLARFGKVVEVRLINYHVAGRTGDAALARAFKQDVWVFILIAVGEVHQVIANLTVDLVPRAIAAHDVETHNISRIAGVLHLELSVEPRRCCAKHACPLRKQWTVHSAMEGRSSDHAE